ncbi:hypothetical protein AB1Y20_008072 [Prymnesium parvum]|uniref:Uncharacterized protein n=1 Tax=Prymnesium parvum TaxID=97485 RepID=A0AB34IVC8_PRYPA
MEECGSVSADCAGVLVRTCRISGSDLSLDTVLYKRETLANATVDPTRPCAGVGSGAIVCYSGLQDTFGKERDGVLANHVQHILRPLSALFPNNTYIAFDTVDRELLPVVMNTLMDEVHIHPSHVISEPREYSDDRRMTLRGQTRAVMQKQFMGIEHCGQLIANVQVARGVDFAFALRLRYDILFSHELRLRDWPIWNMGDEHTAPVLALSKYVTYNLTVRNLPSNDIEQRKVFASSLRLHAQYP